MLITKRKDFWNIVRQCLVKLHGFTVTKAANETRQYRKEIKAEDIEQATYHDEPFDIACEIAHVEANYEQWPAYQKIREYYMSPKSKLGL